MYDLNQVYEANSVEEAIALRQAHPEAQIIAGGSDVLPPGQGPGAGRFCVPVPQDPAPHRRRLLHEPHPRLPGRL